MTDSDFDFTSGEWVPHATTFDQGFGCTYLGCFNNHARAVKRKGHGWVGGALCAEHFREVITNREDAA